MGGRWNADIIRKIKKGLETNDEATVDSSIVKGKLSTFKKYCEEENLLVIFRGEGDALLQLYHIRKNDGTARIQRIYDRMPPYLVPLSEGYSRCWRELPYVEKFLIFNEEEPSMSDRISIPDSYKTNKEGAFKRQVGGAYYKQFIIEPFEFLFVNKIPHHKAAIIRRILRYDHETGHGITDLLKIKHEIELIIELEGYKMPEDEGGE